MRVIFPIALSRAGSADVAKDHRHESRLPVLERKVFLANDEKKEVGPLRRYIVKHGGLSHTWHEPLYRHKDGNYWVHEGSGQ